MTRNTVREQMFEIEIETFRTEGGEIKMENGERRTEKEGMTGREGDGETL